MTDLSFLSRPPSFSFGWAVDDHWPLRSGFDELSEAVRPAKKLAPRKWVVHKAVFQLPGFTELLDRVSNFCRTPTTRAFSAIWERFNQTTSAGDVRRAWLIAGAAVGPQLNPWPELAATPTPQTLLGLIADAGVPVAALSGTLDATVLRLLEG